MPVSASEMKHEERLERSALPSSLQLLFNLEIAFEKELELLHAEVQSESRNWLSKRKKKRNRNFINSSNQLLLIWGTTLHNGARPGRGK